MNQRDQEAAGVGAEFRRLFGPGRPAERSSWGARLGLCGTRRAVLAKVAKSTFLVTSTPSRGGVPAGTSLITIIRFSTERTSSRSYAPGDQAAEQRANVHVGADPRLERRRARPALARSAPSWPGSVPPAEDATDQDGLRAATAAKGP